jgi:hypothetical protein
LPKIAENCDHNIDPRSVAIEESKAKPAKTRTVKQEVVPIDPWKFFDTFDANVFLPSDGQYSTECKICKEAISFDGVDTVPLEEHLVTQHQANKNITLF